MLDQLAALFSYLYVLQLTNNASYQSLLYVGWRVFTIAFGYYFLIK
jgi:hypothetical protein